MTDEQVEKIIKRNMNLQMNLAGIRADFEEASQRPVAKPHKPLSDGDIWDLHIKMSAALDCKLSDLIELTRAVEAAHNIFGNKK